MWLLPWGGWEHTLLTIYIHIYTLYIYIIIYICTYIYIDLLICRLIIIQPSRPDKSCVSWPSGAYRFAHLPRRFLREFDDFGVPGGSFWAQRWMPQATLKDHGSSHAKCFENVAKNAARGCLWEDIGLPKSLLGRPWAQFARHFGGCGWYF